MIVSFLIIMMINTLMIIKIEVSGLEAEDTLYNRIIIVNDHQQIRYMIINHISLYHDDRSMD